MARYGEAMHGFAWRGGVRQGRAGILFALIVFGARRGYARLGVARPGDAGQGRAWISLTVFIALRSFKISPQGEAWQGYLTLSH
jgi:hypothetical protein